MNDNIQRRVLSFTAAQPGYTVTFTGEGDAWSLPLIGYTLTEYNYLPTPSWDDGTPWQHLLPTVLDADGPETIRDYLSDRPGIRWRIVGPGLDSR